MPGAAVFSVEATPDLLATNIPKHMLTPYFAVMTVEEWAANSSAAYEFSHDVWAAGKATDATAPQLWSSMVRMMTELGMEWSAPVYRGTHKLQVGVNGQQNADIMESGIVAMAQQLGLLIKRTGACTPLGDANADDPRTNSSTLSRGAMDMICVTEFEPWLLVAQVRALLLKSLGVGPMELGSISCMHWNVGDIGTTTWRVSIMDAAIHEGTVILTEECAYRGLSRE